MNDFVRPVRRNPSPSIPTRKREHESSEPFVLAEGQPPESDEEAREGRGRSQRSQRLIDLDVGHKPDDEEGALIDVTG